MAAEKSQSSDEELFITQSTYRKNLQVESEQRAQYSDISFDDNEETAEGIFSITKYSDISSDDGVYRKKGEAMCSVASEKTKTKFDDDISDDEELVASCVELESCEEEIAKKNRFHVPLSDEQVVEMQTKKFASATMSKIKWAIGLFKTWQSSRNMVAINSGGKLSSIAVNIEDMTKDELNYSVSRFICEIKKADGTDFPSDSLYGLVVSIQLYMESIGKQYRFLCDDDFCQIKTTLDNIMKQRAKELCNVSKRQAEVISIAEEDITWSKEVLGSDTPKQLVHTLLYLIGIDFALRGGQEHRNLRFGRTSQLKLGHNQQGRFLLYTEDVSKTNQGGLKHRKCEPKSVRAYQNTENYERCIVRLYEKYLQHRLPSDGNNDEPFYLRPLEHPKGEIWYSRQSMGRHNLASVVSNLCERAGLSGYRTNHSLRASAATRLFDAGVDEQLICQVTGHRSNAVRSYKRVSCAQKKKLSSILQGESSSNAKTVKTDDERVSVTVNVNLSKGN